VQRVTNTDKTHVEYVTPPEIFNPLNEEFCFELDAAAEDWNAKCKRYYTREDDGLSKPWAKRTWCNPPYGKDVGRWVEKAHREAVKGNISVLLLPSSTNTKWWHDYIWDSARHAPYRGVQVRFVKGRIPFLVRGSDGALVRAGNPSVNSVIVVFRKPDYLRAWWERIGYAKGQR
jgi:phage N-6-adenine-methyltransferase